VDRRTFVKSIVGAAAGVALGVRVEAIESEPSPEATLTTTHGAIWPAGTVPGDILYRHDSAPGNAMYSVYSADGKVLRGWVRADDVHRMRLQF
jgi:hypothetical protein